MLHFEKWKIVLIAAVCAAGVVFAAPNLLDRESAESLPTFLPHKQISLGLDLQGGSHLLLEVAVDDVIKDRLTALEDEIRGKLRQRPRIGYTGIGVRGLAVSFAVRDPADIDEARRRVRDLEAGEVAMSVDGDRFTLALTEQAIRERRAAVVEQSIEIVRRRIDETGVREPTIQRQGADRILVQLPGVKDPERIKRLLGKTARLTFRLVDGSMTPEQAQAGRPPAGSELLPSDDVDVQGNPQLYLVRKRVMVSGEMLVDARQTVHENLPVVSFRFDAVGGRRFGNATSRNVNRLFAIVLDGQVVSAPRIREPILGGSGIIEGNFTMQSARDLALLLRAGALPAPLTVLEERTVGAEMGADSIRAGKIASVLAVVLVIVFMAAVYGTFGFMADVALLLNMVLIAAALSLLQATLTLPGIAGIVLTIGMAVDANVLIFERIREEQRSGRTPISAVDSGYRRALTTIVDANLTTFFAAALLFFFGSGPVKGFAVTLMIGLATSMFTAMMITRFAIVAWLRRRRPQRLPL